MPGTWWTGFKVAVLDWIYVRNSTSQEENAQTQNASDEVAQCQGELRIQKRALSRFEKVLRVVAIGVPAAFFVVAVTLTGVYAKL